MKLFKRKTDNKTDEKIAGTIELAEGYEYSIPFPLRLLRGLLILAVLFGIGAGFIHYKCKITEYDVKGNTWFTDEEIIEYMKTEKYDDYSVLMKAHYFIKDTPDIPFVKSVDIQVKSLNKVVFVVHEKNIVGCVKVMGEFMYFDKDGYIVASRSEQMHNIPAIDGLKYTQAIVGEKLDVGGDEVFRNILDLTQLISKHEVLISSIMFDKDLNVTLFCADGNIIWLGDNTRYDEAIQALPGILAGAEEKNVNYKLDMSAYNAGDKILGHIIDENGNPTEVHGSNDEEEEPEEDEEGESDE